MDFNITEDDLFGLESMDRNMKLNKNDPRILRNHRGELAAFNTHINYNIT